VVVVRVTKDGPAQKGGVGAGDIIFEVAGKPVSNAEEFFRALWRLGKAGVAVPLTVLQKQSINRLSVPSGDRYQFYQVHPLY
jgi:S1-C subfamily serine protease